MNKYRKTIGIFLTGILYFLICLVTYFMGLRRGLFFGILDLYKVNPALDNSGLAISDKYQILKHFSEYESYLRMGVINYNVNLELMLKDAHKIVDDISFPFIAKPRIGFSSVGIFKINNDADLEKLIRAIKVDYIFQEYCDYQQEYALHFCRDLGTNQIKILALTKRVVDVENVFQNAKKRFVQNTDLTSVISPALIKSVNDILQSKNGINYGRIDLKAKSIESLLKGRFKIIELNGPMSEPVHIYDVKYGIFDIIKEFYIYYELGFYYAKKNNHLKVNYSSILYKFIKKCLFDLPKITSYRLGRNL